MALYVRTFVVENVATIHRRYAASFRLVEDLIAAERAAGVPPSVSTLSLLEASYVRFNRDLDALAKRTAITATDNIKQRIRATRALNRGDTGRGQHLRNAIRSAALPRIGGLATGAVGVADVAILDALRNPIGRWGPYWQAQEYGTAAESARGEVPKQKGRVIRGAFFGRGFSGDPSPPDPNFQGLRVGPHPIFVSSRAGAALLQAAGFSGARGVGKKGGVAGGFGTISVELPGRHFIRDGANLARTEWLSGMRALEFRALRDLRAAGVRVP
jgi:hypothetical protein